MSSGGGGEDPPERPDFVVDSWKAPKEQSVVEKKQAQLDKFVRLGSGAVVSGGDTFVAPTPSFCSTVCASAWTGGLESGLC